MQKNKYQGYKVIDFLKDEDFLRWNLFKMEEDSVYWEGLMNESTELKSLIEQASELYRTQVLFNDYSLTTEQIDDAHDVFQYRAKHKRKSKTLYYWLVGAASVLLLFAINHLFNPFTKQESDLTAFVKGSSFTSDSVSEDIQLYVSSDEFITIDEKEADIVYNADSIRVTGKTSAEVNTTEYSRLVVPRGKRSKLLLSDGTTVHVNSGTKIVYPNSFTGDIREIYVDGEIFLDVAHNQKQPFIVRTNEIAIRVTGTQFNVQAYEEDGGTQVVLASGAVQITPNNHSRKIDLTPSQLYDYKDGQALVKQVDVERYISWVQGLIYVEDESLDNLMTRLSRYYGEKIIFDEELKNQKCSGKVDLKSSLSDVLNGLAFSFNIKVEYEHGVYQVSTK